MSRIPKASGAALVMLLLAAAGTSSHLRASAGQQPPATAQPADGISPEALAQIEALIAEKESRSVTRQKIDSQLIYQLRMNLGQPVAPGLQTLETDVPQASDGHPVLDVQAQVTPALLAQLRSFGAEIVTSTDDSVRVHLDLTQVDAVAALPEVIFIGPRQDAVTTGTTHSGLRGSLNEEAGMRTRSDRQALRKAALSAFLQAAGAAAPETNAGTGQGSQSSQGDVAHRANVARAVFGVDGSGVKIGVLSDGITSLKASQATGDVGPVTVLKDQEGRGGDEGTAMLEIIHDLAPGAQLYFATGFGGIASFAKNIRALREAGCDIIVDDVFYFVETPFQDGQNGISARSTSNGGVVTQAVKDVTASGALYFSSAGNSGNFNDGTGGTWEGDFSPGAAITIGGNSYTLHNFGGQNFDLLTQADPNAPITLYWSDPLGGSSNDYDLFRLNDTGTFVAASSTNFQNGTQDPIEQIGQSVVFPRIIIVKKETAEPRYLHLNTNRGRLSIATPGTTHGHSATDAEGAYSVAATFAGAAFPNAFTSTGKVEAFSSDGPRRIFFHGDGTAITPGNYLAASDGGTVLQKPDFTAADGVSVTGVGNFQNPFFGTSAAAPHAAAIAALLKSAKAALSQKEIRDALTSSAIDIEASGVDRDSGAGIIMAFDALRNIGVPGSFLQLAEVTAAENPGDANGAINPGEGARLTIVLQNFGAVEASAVSARLASSTPGITITEPSATPYPNIAPFVGTATNTAPLLFTVSSTASCPQVASFDLQVAYAGGNVTLPFQLMLGTKTITITSTLDAVAPAPARAYTAVTGKQLGRLNRFPPASVCGTTKPNPGLFTASGSRRFDAYEFDTCSTSAPSCVEVTLINSSLGSGPSLFDVAYVSSFSSSDPLTLNYSGDPGASQTNGDPISFAFTLPRGGTPFAVAVHEVNPGLGVGANYSLQVTGACFGNCDTPNSVPVAKAKDVTVSASPLTCDAGPSIDDGSSDADGDTLTITQDPPGPYPPGRTSVLLTVVDPKGATSQARGSVTVIDDTAPAITCPAPIVVPATAGACSAPVSFTPTATDTCTPVTIVSTHQSGSLFDVGTTTVTSTATDDAGNAAACAFVVTVVDREEPVVSNLSVSTTRLWPPNHKMVDVTVDYALGDNCGGGTCVLSVTSDEPVNGRGDGNTSSDWHVLDAHHVQLRAERSGRGDGRTYTLTLTCTDQAGNATIKTAQVAVRHN